jgi:hypothetical protein
MKDTSRFFVWLSNNDNSINVARNPGNEFVCTCGHGDDARAWANRIVELLNAQEATHK